MLGKENDLSKLLKVETMTMINIQYKYASILFHLWKKLTNIQTLRQTKKKKHPNSEAQKSCTQIPIVAYACIQVRESIQYLEQGSVTYYGTAQACT